MRQLRRGLVFFLVCFLSGSAALFALNVPKRPEGYVSDYAGMLSGAARSRLEQELRDFDERTGNQVVVVTFSGLEGDSLESYSIRLAEAWKPGQKGNDNGVILLMFKEDRKVRIEVGYGLEGVLTDALCNLIIDHEMVPRFRAGDYDGGIERGVTAILSTIRGESQSVSRSGGGNQASSIQVILLGLGLMLGQFVSTALLGLLCLAGALGIVVSLAIGNPLLTIGSVCAFLLGLLLLGVRFFFPLLLVNASGFSGLGSYRGYGGGGLGGFGSGFSGGGGGFGGGGASGSW